MTALRKVMVSKWTPSDYVPATATTPAKTVYGAWEEVGEALFHGFGVDYEEFESGAGNYSTAIVEWPDGQVEMVRADKIRFLEPAALEGSDGMIEPRVGDEVSIEGIDIAWVVQAVGEHPLYQGILLSLKEIGGTRKVQSLGLKEVTLLARGGEIVNKKYRP